VSDFISEAEYVILCEGCDSLLLAEDSSLERVAIPWLHIIREHPMFLKKYVNLFNSNATSKSWREKVPYFVSSLAKFIKYFHSKGSYYHSSIDQTRKLDILFVSHLLNRSDAGKPNDSYFGDIPNRLSELGFKVGIVMLNHSDLKAKAAAERWKNSITPRFIFSPILPFKQEVILLFRLMKESKKLKEKASNLRDGFLKELTKNAAKQATSSLTQNTYRLVPQIAKLLVDFNPETIVTTFEGHAWERIVYSEARRLNNNILCVGYQHAAIFKLQHAIRRNLSPEYNPDFILAAGQLGKVQLATSNEYKKMQINVLGSDRGNMDINRQDYIFNAPDISKMCCLVLPEGDFEECKKLFEFSLDCAISFPKIRFIWRLHPILTFKQIFRKYPHLSDFPLNITLSNGTSLIEDINQACMVLYRGTTSVIQSIKGGLIPLYLIIPDEMIIDPLYEISQGKVILKRLEDFKYFVENISDFVKENQDERICLLKYCETFYTNFDVDLLVNIIQNKPNQS
jgi:hypothetical protein